jgi:hypothetical protein
MTFARSFSGNPQMAESNAESAMYFLFVHLRLTLSQQRNLRFTQSGYHDLQETRTP